MNAPLGLLLMAYGSPSTLDDVEAYYTHIRGGRTPPPERIEELRERYRRIGGRSPLLDITRRLAVGVQAAFDQLGVSVRVYVGMKHAPPFITDVVEEMAQDGVVDAVGLALAPHYSRLSAGAYIATVSDAAAHHGISLPCVESWHDHPGFIRAVSARLHEAQQRLGDGEGVPVIFTAHSLPQRILEWHDPYPDELHRTCQAVAKVTGLRRWLFAYQSASHTGEPWLGPDIAEVLTRLAEDGERAVLICPVGFVSDHLEILHDIDIEAKALAAARGMRLERTRSLNDATDFVAVLVELLRDHVPREHLGETGSGYRR